LDLRNSFPEANLRSIPRRAAASSRVLIYCASLGIGWATLAAGSARAEAPVSPAPATTPAAAAPDEVVARFFAAHCNRCHGPKQAEGNLRLDTLRLDLDDAANFSRWRTVADRIRTGEMPPEDEPRPDPAETTTVVRRLAHRLDEAAARQRAEGRTVLRRLNRVEYENTVRDLFDVRVNVKEILPEDTISHGFDNIGSALSISPVQMERYLEAADAVLDAALAPVPHAERKTERFDLYDSIPSWFLRSVRRPKSGTGVHLYRSDGSPTAIDGFKAPIPGRYRVKISAYAHQSKEPLPFSVHAGYFRAAVVVSELVGYFDAPPEKPAVIEFEARLEKPRDTFKIMPADLPRVYLKPETMEEYPGPSVVVEWVEIDGPLPEPDPSPAYKRVFGDVDPKRGTIADAQELLAKFTSLAFRLPYIEGLEKPYLALVEKSLAEGETFEQGMRTALKAILCSPQFLYLREGAGPLDDFSLVSRLSYFLWSTTPDEPLIAAAYVGNLADPKNLRSQVERMLADPKARAFTENFCGQWLSLRDIKATTPDKQLYPEFDELLEWSMVRETEAFFDEMLKNDLPVTNFVDSDFAILNARLAKHYGIAGVEGASLRRVPLKPEAGRGGVLGQAAVLKVTANGTTTSPVVRGVWVLDRIMGRPVKPPPANVPAIEPDIRGATTIRDQLAKHREIASCAACHAEIDPPGFALEQYDVIGGRRTKYRALGTKEKIANPPSPIYKYQAKPQYGEGLAVDAGDKLPDGRTFADAAEFKKLLLADRRQIARTVTRKLVTYATGQAPQYGDDAEIEKILNAAEAKGYGLRTLIHEVVQSELFRNK
jgi:mono/diheme cytochrome c family protein